MILSTQIKRAAHGVVLLALGGAQAFAGTLTSNEVAQIETAFGITLTAQEKTDLGAIAKPDASPAWRTAADGRIDSFRKASLTVQVEDANSYPVPGAQVAVKLNKNAFKFGGVVTVMDLTDASGDLAAEGSSVSDWKNITTNLFNAAGLNNGFKPKITSQHQYIPNFLTWASNNNIDVRGHTLMWPGGGGLADLGGTPGSDYGDHLSTSSTSAYAHYNVLGAVQTYAASAQGPADKAALKAAVDAEIAEWAGQWNVYEWDVINETIGNKLLQEILGYDQMAEWFKIAETNMVGADTGLYINEFKIISADHTDGGTQYNSRKATYMNRIDTVIADGGPITGIGFQSRYKYGHIDPATVYIRLDDFASAYPAFTLSGTEFEVKDGPDYTYTEYERAQITEEIMTTYYSHDQVLGLNAWDFMNASTEPSAPEEPPAALAWYDGTIKLNGLVWYYLHRIRYNTETNNTTDGAGATAISGYKGDYAITVSYNGTDYPATATLSSNQTVVVALGDVFLAPSDNPPVFTVDPINKPSGDTGVAYTGESITNSATDADGDTLFYSKIAGPSWLAIAPNGDLSGTPSSTDAGQNSWIVQVSDGYDTALATLGIAVNGTGGPPASISIEDSASTGFSSGSGAVTGTVSTTVSAQVGDVIVVTAATNKKGDPGTSPVSLTQTGGSGTAGTPTLLTNELTTYPTSWGWYQTVTSAGTFTYELASMNITASAALHVLRADTGQIALEDSATWDDNDNANNGTSYSLDYTFGGALTDGVLIEAIGARTDLITAPAAYTETINGGDKRIVSHFDGVTNSTWSSAYSLSGGDANKQTSGALGMVFVGLGTVGGGNAPPIFSSDPVVEAGAVQDAAYTGSSLADNASDGDLDTMSFGLISGPAWLNVATNGALSGTPLAIHLGTNSWKVLVTDGTATNFASLQVVVNEPPPPPVSPQNGTNILFIAIDDINPVLGCYGDPLAISPNIDSLAASGVTFLNAHCQWSVCGPSRASLMTGLMPEETGVLGFKKMRGDADDPSKVNDVKRPNVVTIPQYFRYNGYRTTGVGKINDNRCVGSMDTGTKKVAEDGNAVDDPPSWGEPVDVNALPVDFFSSSSFVQAAGGFNPPGNPSVYATNLPDSVFTDGIICDESLVLLQNLATNDTQFFLGVGFKKPHLAFVAPEQYWNMHTNTPFAIHPFQDHPLHEVSYTWNYAAELAGYDDIVDETNIPEAKQLELIHGYYACVSFIDAQVGRLLDELEAQGLHTNTIVVLWGDHGFHLGDHAEWAKHTNLEQATRVPFIIHNPFAGQSGVQSDTPAALMDIYPTLCEMVGLPVPQQPLAENEDPFDPASGRSLKGRSLAGVVSGTTNSVRTGAVNLYRRSGHNGYAYRTDRYRYTEWVNNSGNVVDARELYDYLLDPMETVNLAGEPGYDALMYSFSRAMRKEFDDMKLSGTDIAAAELQGSPAATAPADRKLPSLDGNVNGGTVGLNWPDATGSTYNVLEKTNLLDSAWTTNQADVAGSPASAPADKPQAFFRIEVSN